MLGERRWYGVPRRGMLSVGSALAGDVQLTGHNMASRHVVLTFGSKDRVTIDVRSPYGVRVNARLPRAGDPLGRGDILRIGPWHLVLENAPATPWTEAEDAFLATFAREAPANDARLVYADWLEDSDRLPEAEVMRATLDGARPAAELAVRTPPSWRRRLVPAPIEACAREGCGGRWDLLHEGDEPERRACGPCGLRVTYAADIGTARRLALQGKPIAIDPAVHREAEDLREPARKRLAVEMGRPAR